MMFGMFVVFPKLAWKCALDPLAGLVDEPVKDEPRPELDEPKDGE